MYRRKKKKKNGKLLERWRSGVRREKNAETEEQMNRTLYQEKYYFIRFFFSKKCNQSLACPRRKQWITFYSTAPENLRETFPLYQQKYEKSLSCKLSCISARLVKQSAVKNKSSLLHFILSTLSSGKLFFFSFWNKGYSFRVHLRSRAIFCSRRGWEESGRKRRKPNTNFAPRAKNLICEYRSRINVKLF